MRDVEVTAATAGNITSHVLEAYPNECCGFVVRRGDRQEVVRVTNIQSARHAEDPQRSPRTAATAYTMGPDALPVLSAHDRGDLIIEAIYHSHPGHDAYFSAADHALATSWGEPAYADAAQIVISVRQRQVKEMKAYRWDAKALQFLQASLVVL